MGLQHISTITVFDVVIIEGYNAKGKPKFGKYTVSTKNLSKFLLDHQQANNTIIGVYPLEETKDVVKVDEFVENSEIDSDSKYFDGY